MPVCPVFAVGLDGKCGTGEQRLQGSLERAIGCQQPWHQ